MEQIFVARQPIYNRALEVVGYELLFRDAHAPAASFTDGAQASSRLIINTFMSLGLENIVGSNPAFINLTADFFLDEQPIPMSREQIVLEIPAASLNNAKVLQGLLQLAEAGYQISIDDFVYSPEIEPVLRAASYIKLDLTQFSKEQLSQQHALCEQHHVATLAKKVETLEDLEMCREIGFQCYQGYFFCKPDIIQGKIDVCNRGILLNIVEQLQDPDATMADMADVITQDVGLSYKLLRYINCATYAIRREIESIKDALVMIGTETVKKWAILILMSNYNTGKPMELSNVAMIRAYMCELLANKITGMEPQQAFTVGLFSTLDAVMDTPMEELLDSISLTSSIKFALLDYEGELGELLKQVLHYERGDWDRLNTGTLGHNDYSDSYLAAVQWANNNRALLQQ